MVLGGSKRKNRKAFILFLLVSGIVLLVCSSESKAGDSYLRPQCVYTPYRIGIEPVWGKFSFVSAGMEQTDNCATQGYLRFKTTAGQNKLPQGSNTYRTWYAPPGTVFQGVSFLALPESMEGGWQIQMIQIRDSVEKVVYTKRLSYGRVETLKTFEQSDYFTGFKLRLICRWAAGCLRQPITAIKLYNMEFHLRDNIYPSVSVEAEKDRPNNTWLKGKSGEQFKINGEDSQSGLGLASLSFVKNLWDLGFDLFLSKCNRNTALFQVCPAQSTSWFSVNTNQLSSGRYVWHACVRDFSNNESCRAFERLIDNTLPVISPSNSPPPTKAGSVLDISVGDATDAHSGVAVVIYKAGISEEQTKEEIIKSESSTKCIIVNLRDWNCEINTSEYPNGSHIFVYAFAVDKAGNVLGGPADPSKGFWLTPDEGILVDRSAAPVISLEQRIRENYFQNEKIPVVIKVLPESQLGRLEYKCWLDQKRIACSRRFTLERLQQGTHDLTIQVEDIDSGAKSLPLDIKFNVIPPCYPTVKSKRLKVIKTKKKDILTAVLVFDVALAPPERPKAIFVIRNKTTGKKIFARTHVGIKKLKKASTFILKMNISKKKLKQIRKLSRKKKLLWQGFSSKKCVLP